jgi:hypothetical protein
MKRKKENGGKMSVKIFGEVGHMVLRQYFLLGAPWDAMHKVNRADF